MKLATKIAVITFAVFMVEAVIHYNLGKDDCEQMIEKKGIIPPPESLLKLALVVGLFSVINAKLING